MAKKKIEKIAVEFRKLIAEKKLIIGSDRTIKHLKQGKLKQVYLAANCGEKTKADIMQFGKLAKIDVKELPNSSSELGIFCKKPFSISVIGVLK